MVDVLPVAEAQPRPAPLRQTGTVVPVPGGGGHRERDEGLLGAVGPVQHIGRSVRSLGGGEKNFGGPNRCR